MLLLNRRKDYYDYLISIFGVDTNKVFNRCNDITASEVYFEDSIRWRNSNIYDLLICKRRYRVEQVTKGVWELHKFHECNRHYDGTYRHYRASQVEGLNGYVDYKPLEYEDLGGYPIAIEGTYHTKKGRMDGVVPILESFGIPAVYEPMQLYSEIDMYLGWLMSEEEKNTVQDDGDKLKSHGFDSKISFRHRK